MEDIPPLGLKYKFQEKRAISAILLSQRAHAVLACNVREGC